MRLGGPEPAQLPLDMNPIEPCPSDASMGFLCISDDTDGVVPIVPETPTIPDPPSTPPVNNINGVSDSPEEVSRNCSLLEWTHEDSVPSPRNELNALNFVPRNLDLGEMKHTPSPGHCLPGQNGDNSEDQVKGSWP